MGLTGLGSGRGPAEEEGVSEDATVEFDALRVAESIYTAGRLSWAGA